MGVKTGVSSFSRPADTTAYADGDLVANSTTAGQVTALTWTILPGDLRRILLRTSNATITNGSFSLWLFRTTPAALVTNGDNGALAGLSFTTYGVIAVCPIVLQASMGGVGGWGEATYDPGLIQVGGTFYGLLQARAAYVPASSETIGVELEVTP